MIGNLAKKTFDLDRNFLKNYINKQPNWGHLGYITFLRTYSRTKDDGSKESYYDTVKRVVEGTFSIQKNYCKEAHLPWDESKAQRTAQRMYAAIWNFKFLPPGRGLWIMGTEHLVKCGGAALNNCAFVSTEHIRDNPSRPFCFLFDMMMLGVGVGFDTKGSGKIPVLRPQRNERYVIADTREGWVDSVRALLDSFTVPDSPYPEMDYSQLRAPGVPLKTFGGVSSGPQPLRDLHKQLTTLLSSKVGSNLSSTDILDIMTMIGRCVNSGNIRRGAEIALGDLRDSEFLLAKSRQALGDNPHRHMSNNSLIVPIGSDYSDAAKVSAINGEPGYFWIENAQQYGRLADPRDYRDMRVAGTNPCGEQSLESYELCNLVETFPARHSSLQEYLDTLKLAYLYAKTVTLIPTHVPETNAVTLRNRRIGCSQSGITRAFSRHGRREILRWCDTAYQYIVALDKQYSSWLCVPESIKRTSVKPSGTTSLLPGEPAGIHYPHSEYYIRRMRIASDDPLIPYLKEAGYHVEPDKVLPLTEVVDFPIREQYFDRSKYQVSMWEQLENVAAYQYYWSDNQVSATVTFRAEEANDIKRALELYETRLKSISFLPLENHNYSQAPYEEITKQRYTDMMASIKALPSSLTPMECGSKFCDNDVCTI